MQILVILSSYQREKAELKAAKPPLATEVTLAAFAGEVAIADTPHEAESPKLGRDVEAEALLESVKLQH